MIFELRTYTTKPGKAPYYLDLFRTSGVDLVTKHLPMLGYWLSDVGDLNRIHHLWVYENFEERMAKRASLAGETQWNEGFIKTAFEVVIAQESRFMSLESSSKTFDSLVLTRNSVHSRQEADQPCFSNGWNLLSKSETALEHSPQTVANFKVTMGTDIGAYYSILDGKDVDAMLPDAAKMQQSTLMRPLQVSPIR